MATKLKTSAYILTVAIPLKTQHPYFLKTDSLRKGQLKDLKCYAKLRYSKMSDNLNSGKIIPTKEQNYKEDLLCQVLQNL